MSDEEPIKDTPVEGSRASGPERSGVPPSPPPAKVEKPPELKSPEKKVEGEVHRERQNVGKGKVLLIVLAIFAIVLIAAYFTITLEQSPPYANVTYPWSTTYEVLFPDGKQVFIGSTSIIALTYQDEVIIDVDGNREKMVLGEERLISERRAAIKVLGIPIVETNYQMFIKFIAVEDKNIKFNLTLKTSRQVPQFLINRILPSEIQAHPV